MGPMCRQIDISDFSQSGQCVLSCWSLAFDDNATFSKSKKLMRQMCRQNVLLSSSHCRSLMLVIRARSVYPQVRRTILNRGRSDDASRKPRVAVSRETSGLRAAKLVEHVIAQHC
jgi:hypothetical protein